MTVQAADRRNQIRHPSHLLQALCVFFQRICRSGLKINIDCSRQRATPEGFDLSLGWPRTIELIVREKRRLIKVLFVPAQRAAVVVLIYVILVNKKVLAMAEDFPEAKYDYRPSKDVRSFAEVILHIASSNNYVAKAANGDKVEFVELAREKYTTKADVVAALKQSIDDSTAFLKQFTDERLAKSPAPWPGFIEHAGEHYGQLVVYYRVNGLVPPASRPKEKTD